MKCPECGFNSFDFIDRCKKCGSSIDINPRYRVIYKRIEDSRRKKNDHISEDHVGNVEYREQTKSVNKSISPPADKKIIDNLLDIPISEDVDLDTDNQELSHEIDNFEEDQPKLIEKELTPFDFAGFLPRFSSFIIDLIIVICITITVSLSGIITAFKISGLDINYIITITVRVFFFLFFLSSSYFVFLEGYSGKTIGKMIMGIKVIKDDGNTIDLISAFTRWLVSFISASFLFLGFIWALFDRRSQTWHDKITGTIVVFE
ncbi:MAG: RDD family protein [Thermodesulfobacteriota bacterium]